MPWRCGGKLERTRLSAISETSRSTFTLHSAYAVCGLGADSSVL